MCCVYYQILDDPLVEVKATIKLAVQYKHTYFLFLLTITMCLLNIKAQCKERCFLTMFSVFLLSLFFPFYPFLADLQNQCCFIKSLGK